MPGNPRCLQCFHRHGPYAGCYTPGCCPPQPKPSETWLAAYGPGLPPPDYPPGYCTCGHPAADHTNPTQVCVFSTHRKENDEHVPYRVCDCDGHKLPGHYKHFGTNQHQPIP